MGDGGSSRGFALMTDQDVELSRKEAEQAQEEYTIVLREFTDGLPWCHVDIAGTGMINGHGTGFGVRLITQLAKDVAR